MGKNKKDLEQITKLNKPDFTNNLWEKSWTYIKKVVEIVHEPVLILNKDLRVMAVNESFCRVFQVESNDTEGQIVYELGNGQWNIPALRKLLEDILPQNTFFKGFEVIHKFPSIGQKTMILNARQIHFKEDITTARFPSIILLAIEDITDIMLVAETLAGHAKQLETKFIERTAKLEKEINILKMGRKTKAISKFTK